MSTTAGSRVLMVELGSNHDGSLLNGVANSVIVVTGLLLHTRRDAGQSPLYVQINSLNTTLWDVVELCGEQLVDGPNPIYLSYNPQGWFSTRIGDTLHISGLGNGEGRTLNGVLTYELRS